MRSMSRSLVPEMKRSSGRLLAAVVLLCSMTQASAGRAASITVSSKSLTTYMACTLSGSLAASASELDSYVDQNAPNTNNGAVATMNSESRLNRNRRPYVIFDLTTCSPTIPNTATVTSATLRLWVTAMPAACRTEDVFAATAPWGEATITWNNQPFGVATNNPASGSRTDFITVGSGGGCTIGSTGQYVSWNVTADVVRFVAGTSTNNGWMIRDDAEDAAAANTVTFTSSDAASVPHAPQLIVVYKK
jgi:hypothetical protein